MDCKDIESKYDLAIIFLECYRLEGSQEKFLNSTDLKNFKCTRPIFYVFSTFSKKLKMDACMYFHSVLTYCKRNQRSRI